MSLLFILKRVILVISLSLHQVYLRGNPATLGLADTIKS